MILCNSHDQLDHHVRVQRNNYGRDLDAKIKGIGEQCIEICKLSSHKKPLTLKINGRIGDVRINVIKLYRSTKNQKNNYGTKNFHWYITFMVHPLAAVLAPVFAMVLLQLIVTILMISGRVGIIDKEKVKINKYPTRSDSAALFAPVEKYANNFQNLLELPILFYVLTILMIVSNTVSPFFLICSWVFVGFRYIHSAIQCTINNVQWRFLAFLASNLALFLAWANFAITIFL